MTKIHELEELGSPDNDDALLIARETDGKWFKVLWSNLGGGGGEANPTAASQAEAEAGAETALRSWSPLRVKQAIAALGVSLPATVGQAEAEAGTATTTRLWTAQRVKQAIAALGATLPATVGQAEAEAGTATTARLWTAQRVKQAIDALGGSGGGSVFSFCQYRNSAAGSNLNTTVSAITFGGTTDASHSDFTATTSTITVNFDGTVNVQAHISQTGTGDRTNVGIRITLNNSTKSGVGQSAYIRAAGGHNEASSHISATFDVSDGDVIRIACVSKADAGTVTQIAGESQVTVERRA